MIVTPIGYFSTNQAILGPDLEARIRDGSLETVGLAESIIAGQAPDGGLFMPTHFPQISSETIAGMRNMSYAGIFVEVMKDYFHDVLSEETLEQIAKEAYEGDNPFEPFIESLPQIDDIGTSIDHISRLDEGPSAAFKDYAAQVLFRVIEALRREKPNTLIRPGYSLSDSDLLTFITATSGDTGGAMGHAILNRDRMWMVILYSAFVGKEISSLQAKQMDTLGFNTHTLRVETDFDGAQKMSQELLSDPELEYMNLNSANSINIGRLLPQIAYYFHIYSRVAENPGEEVAFAVPSGNFGNAVAGLFAQRMGLPIKLIIGVNENDVYSEFYDTGLYKPSSEIHSSPSNSMNIIWASNMRRLFQLYGGQLVEGKDPDNPERKVIQGLTLPDLRRMRQDIIGAYSISDEETDRIIVDFHNRGYEIEYDGGMITSTLEPHGAVAYGAAQMARKDGYTGKIVVLETAHPAKFPESLDRNNIKIATPANLEGLQNGEGGNYILVPNDLSRVREIVKTLHRQELAKYN
tara:strand:- start:19089 stop:20651 length:1563 start_codon:yes stop_codon:yes gene_type:complete